MTELGSCSGKVFVVFKKVHAVESDCLVYDTKPFRERRKSVYLSLSVHESELELLVSHWRNGLCVSSVSVQSSLPLSLRL